MPSCSTSHNPKEEVEVLHEFCGSDRGSPLPCKHAHTVVKSSNTFARRVGIQTAIGHSQRALGCGESRGTFAWFNRILTGCTSAGQARGQALDNVMEVIEMMLQYLAQQGLSVPDPGETITEVEVN